MYQYRIEHVRKVKSGDTLSLILDLGFRVSTTADLRLDGAETPEYGSFDRYGKDEGAVARDYTVKWFAEHPAPFVVHTTKDRRDEFTGTVYDAEGVSLAADLIQEGYGRPTQ